MAMIQIGAKNLIIGIYKFFRLKSPELSTSSMISFGLITEAANMQVQNAAIGIKMLLLRKSKKSRKLKPRSLI